MKNGTSNQLQNASENGGCLFRAALRDVLEQLVKYRAVLPPREDDPAESGDYYYLEFELPDATDLAIDLCVHRGRAYVRLER